MCTHAAASFSACFAPHMASLTVLVNVTPLASSEGADHARLKPPLRQVAQQLRACAIADLTDVRSAHPTVPEAAAIGRRRPRRR
jgi:hypothetical protein